ncbi:MAG: HlyD family efflux transporter periplasmic adaptor subunit [Bythopirellula sp.]|nr:HlyD family efflux transporter periplasmic adaptor subunit [Bythopirellula sp.]
MNMATNQSQPAEKIDLSQLAVDRGPSKPVETFAPKSPWVTRYALPLGILVAFVSLFAWAARDTFLPATSVTVTPVIVSRAEIKQAGTPLFQAAGWIEPRPTAVLASSLAPGVIEELLVVEGQEVKKGEPVAQLIAADAKITLREAQSTLQLREAELNRAEASLTAAQANLEQPSELQAIQADAAAKLANTRLSLGNLPFQLEAAKARREFAAENLARKEQVGEAVSGKAVREARAELAAASSVLNELEAREPMLQAELAALIRKRDALAKQLELMTNERRAVSVAAAEVSAARAVADQAELAVETAELNLDRMTVRAPIAGRILSLEARPGQRLSGNNPLAEQGSSAVVSLYDPAMLQVRVDVRLEDVPQVQVGQPATIQTAALAEPITGTVLSVTTRADIQKNTLQVKVGIDAPPEVIKPEMLAKVTFVAPPSPVSETVDGQSPLRIFAPQALVSSGEGGASIWVADLTSRVAQLKPVEIGQSTPDGGLVEVTSGLTPTDKLIVGGRESLTEGARIRVAGEDNTMQTNTPSSAIGHSSANRTALAPTVQN